MRILVDLDDTLVNMMEKALYYYNDAIGRTPKLEMSQLTSWELENRWAFEEIWRIPGFFADLPWMDDSARPALHSLVKDGHEIVIVSAVPTWESCLSKYQWCHTHLKIPGIIQSMDQVVLTRGKDYIEGECMVDDKPSNLTRRRFPILFDRPWNRRASGYSRAYDWEGVREHVADCAYIKSRGGTTYFMGGTL